MEWTESFPKISFKIQDFMKKFMSTTVYGSCWRFGWCIIGEGLDW